MIYLCWGGLHQLVLPAQLLLLQTSDMLGAHIISRLGQDPERSERINANSFQQHSLTTVQGWQYAALYIQNAPSGKRNVATSGGVLTNL